MTKVDELDGKGESGGVVNHEALRLADTWNATDSSETFNFVLSTSVKSIHR